MATMDPSLNETMTQMQLRLLRQKIADERGRGSRVSQGTPREDFTENNIRLQQAKLRRQELMHKIQREQQLSDDLRRSRSFTERHHDMRSPIQVAPRRAESQPQFGGDSNAKHVVEHQFRPMRLDPLDSVPRLPPSMPQMMQPPQPFVLTVPPAPVAPIMGQPPNTKAEMVEMMMMQNAQMHQMVMQQLMMSAIPKPPPQPQQPESGHVSRGISLDIEDIVGLRSEKKRPPSVHHHHYERPPQQSQPYFTLPPIQQMPPYPYHSPRYYPSELEPLKQPRARRKPKPKTPAPLPPPKIHYGELPFPGPWGLRKFRHAAYAVFFSKALPKILRKRKLGEGTYDRSLPRENILFAIRLKEAVAAIHNIYLRPGNKIGQILRQFTGDGSADLTLATQQGGAGSDQKSASENLSYIMENVVYEMTDIMPPEGVLGTHRKAVVFDMLQDAKQYPKGYLWQLEYDLVPMDSTGRTANIGEYGAYVLITGLFLGRGLITTLLLKPVEYGLTESQPGYRGQQNLKVIASMFTYLLRKVYVTSKQQPLEIPYELQPFLATDIAMAGAYKKLKTSIEYSQKLISTWGKEYTKRLRAVSSL